MIQFFLSNPAIISVQVDGISFLDNPYFLLYYDSFFMSICKIKEYIGGRYRIPDSLWELGIGSSLPVHIQMFRELDGPMAIVQ